MIKVIYKDQFVFQEGRNATSSGMVLENWCIALLGNLTTLKEIWIILQYQRT